MSLHLVPHMPRLVVMVAKFLMYEEKVSNLIYLFDYLFYVLGTFQPDGCKPSVLLTFPYVIEKRSIFPSYKYNLSLPLAT